MRQNSGIGGYRIVKILKLNDAELEILPRVFEFSKKGKDGTFEHNQFKTNSTKRSIKRIRVTCKSKFCTY